MRQMYLDRMVMTKYTSEGRLSSPDGLFTCRTLELPDKDNTPRVSCIPDGWWTFRRRFSNHNGCEVFTGVDIPGRSLINIEVANYARQLLGCIALGTTSFDLDGDGVNDVAHSREAFTRFMRHMTGVTEFHLRIQSPAQRAA